MSTRPPAPLLGAAIALGTLAACASPEARRVQGGGAGADPGNRDPIVELHGGSQMYYDTPCLISDRDECPGTHQASGLPEEFPEPEREEKGS